MQYALVEIDEGLTVTELPSGMTAEQVAERDGSVVIDPGPFQTYDEAYEALLSLPEGNEDSEAAE